MSFPVCQVIQFTNLLDKINYKLINLQVTEVVKSIHCNRRHMYDHDISALYNLQAHMNIAESVQ